MAAEDEDKPSSISINAESLADSLTKKLEKPGNVEELRTIFRVPRSDTDAEENAAYEPKYVSIGPFHHGKEALQLMEPLKRALVGDLFSRSDDSRLMSKCIQMVAEEELRARRHYNGKTSLEPDEFVEMLVIDGCFIIEFLVRFYLEYPNIAGTSAATSLNTQEATTKTTATVPTTVPDDADTPLIEGQDAATATATSLNLQDGSTSTTNSLAKTDSFLDLRSDILYRLENQIPFFILEALYSQLLSDGSIPEKKNVGTEIRGLTDLALFYIHMGEVKSPSFQPIPKPVYHLLHLFHATCKPPHKKDDTTNGKEKQQSVTGSDKQSETKEEKKKLQPGTQSEMRLGRITKACCYISMFLLLLPVYPVLLVVVTVVLVLVVAYISLSSLLLLPVGLVFLLLGLCLRKKPAAWPSDDEKSVASRMIPCATDLRNAGIRFEKKKDADNHLDVTFDEEKRTLEIPVFSITDETACRYRNLIALEKYFPIKERYFTSFAALMMNLMETKVDVSILKSQDILKSKLGSDKQVPHFFIKLCKGGHFSYREHCFEGLFDDLKKYYKTTRSALFRWRATLIPDYFTNPWAIPSMIAASLLLVVTVLQTVYTILTYYQG